MSDREVIDSELRLIGAVRRALGELGGPLPSASPMMHCSTSERGTCPSHRTSLSVPWTTLST